MASQPKNKWATQQRGNKFPNSVAFVPQIALYMEPSDFNYDGLRKQRDGGGYDNFLRSNIDNEQDKRNFQTEPGRDHLPFRSYEGAATDKSNTVLTKIPNASPGPTITAVQGTPFLVPLRWNNPHASELEVNVWLTGLNVTQGNEGRPVVVPIRKPTCSGEGHQDNVFSLTVPSDFNQLPSKVVGFSGCKAVGDCVLQIYAHSVEARTYAMGTPFIVNLPAATVWAATTNSNSQIKPFQIDSGVAGLARKTPVLCLSSSDPSANIVTAVPHQPRLVSDQFNHAYQNSDYSPYSGQQPQHISQNLQAASIISMVTGNRGELGKALFAKKPGAQAFQKKLEQTAKELVRTYESIANQIIDAIGKQMTNNATLVQGQRTAKCFRCAEVGAVVAQRQTTNTYIPSFDIPNSELLAKAKQYVSPQYDNLISGNTVRIYAAVVDSLSDMFVIASKNFSMGYMPAVIKPKITTMADAFNFLKVDASKKADKGLAAASASKASIKEEFFVAGFKLFTTSPFTAALEEETATFITSPEADMNGLNYDNACDLDKNLDPETGLPNSGVECLIPGQNTPKASQLFADVGQSADTYIPSTNSGTTFTVSWVAAFGVAVVAMMQF